MRAVPDHQEAAFAPPPGSVPPLNRLAVLMIGKALRAGLDRPHAEAIPADLLALAGRIEDEHASREDASRHGRR